MTMRPMIEHNTKFVFEGKGLLELPAHGECSACDWKGSSSDSLTEVQEDCHKHEQENPRIYH